MCLQRSYNYLPMLVIYTEENFVALISNKMQRYTVYLYLETALHVSCGTSTYYQERIQLYLQHLLFVTPLLLPVAFLEELEQLQHLQDSSR